MTNCTICGGKEEDHKQGVCVCTITCTCWKFEAPYTNPDVDRYLFQIEKFVDKMQWVLLNLKYFRNYNNQELLFAWWSTINHIDLTKHSLGKDDYFKLDSAESITRARRYWVELDKEKYGKFEPSVEEQQKYKQTAFEEFFVMVKQ